MNKEEARQLFPLALRDELSAEQASAFEQALSDHPGLEREFEAFADTEAGGGVENINAWLEHTADAVPVDTTDAYRQMAREVIQRAEGQKRGRLISILGATAAAVAAAAVVAVLIFPTGGPAVEEWPENTPGAVTVMHDGYRHYESAVEEFHPAEGVTLGIDGNTLIRPHERGARLDRGSVRVKLEEGASYDIHVGDHRVEAQGPGELTVSAEPLRYPDTSFMKLENDPMLDSRILSRFGAKGFAMALTVVAGSATLHGAQVHSVNAPQTLQANPGPAPQAPKPPKPADIFDHLDSNDDGVLDNTEVPARMISDFDDDSSGDVDLDEFKAHHKPPLPPNPGDAFRILDKNKDGVLDNNEVDQQMLTDFDDDGSGDIDLQEFTAHYKPKQRTARDEFDHLDVNGDGVLDSNEIPQKLINKLDKDNSGDVDLAEFTPHFNRRPGPKPGPRPGEGFDHIDLDGDGKLDNTEVPQDMINDWDKDNSGDLDQQEWADGHKPPTPEEAFDNLDANGDGKLDSSETAQRMIDDFDDDASGDIDEDEFKDHWRPHPPKPEDAFDNLDKNGDGELDVNELPRAHVNDWDDDGNGTVDLDEFKAHHPKPKPGPGGPGGPGGKGPGGPGGGNGPGGNGPGNGPGGPGGGPGGNGPGGNGPGGPRPPRPPRK